MWRGVLRALKIYLSAYSARPLNSLEWRWKRAFYVRKRHRRQGMKSYYWSKLNSDERDAMTVEHSVIMAALVGVL